MAQSKTYKLPVPEFLDPADAPNNFKSLAQAIEGKAYPRLQGWNSWTGDVNLDMSRNGQSLVLYSEQIGTSGIVGWVDVDAYILCSQGYPPSGTAGQFNISMNGVQVGYTRYHNFWRAQNMMVYCSARWPNPTGAPATITVRVWIDGPDTPAQHLHSTGMSYQIYGAKVF